MKIESRSLQALGINILLLLALGLTAAIAQDRFIPYQGDSLPPPTANQETAPSIDPKVTYDSSREAGPHHRWRVTRNENGEETGRYMALATGLNRWIPESSAWQEASVNLNQPLYPLELDIFLFYRETIRRQTIRAICF